MAHRGSEATTPAAVISDPHPKAPGLPPPEPRTASNSPICKGRPDSPRGNRARDAFLMRPPGPALKRGKFSLLICRCSALNSSEEATDYHKALEKDILARRNTRKRRNAKLLYY